MNSTHTSAQEQCGCSCCERPVLCRPRYFPRQLLTPDDLSLEADYFRDALRRMRRMLWGYGVVCGAVVCRAPKCQPGAPQTKPPYDPEGKPGSTGQSAPSTIQKPEWEPWTVIVKPGYILGPCGDEIIVPCEYRWDFRKAGTTTSSGDPCPEPCDPFCTEIGKPPQDRTFCIAIKYKQIMTRPVRVQPVGCGCCEDAPCEYSRWCDGYELGLLRHCPECHEEEMCEPVREYGSLFHQGVPVCPPCPDTPWVCLAKVKVDPCGCIIYLGNCDCRRLAVSFSKIWWKCAREECCDVDLSKEREPQKQDERREYGSEGKGTESLGEPASAVQQHGNAKQRKKAQRKP